MDRIYLSGYAPNVQAGGQVAGEMTCHLGDPIPSPAILEKLGTMEALHFPEPEERELAQKPDDSGLGNEEPD